MGEITDLLKQGKKIEAIKRYREIYSCGLQEAVKKIELLDAELKASTVPQDRFVRPISEFFTADQIVESKKQDADEYYNDLLNPDRDKDRERAIRRKKSKGVHLQGISQINSNNKDSASKLDDDSENSSRNTKASPRFFLRIGVIIAIINYLYKFILKLIEYLKFNDIMPF